MTHKDYFYAAAQELENGITDKALLAKAQAGSAGDEAKTRSIYITLKAAELERESYTDSVKSVAEGVGDVVLKTAPKVGGFLAIAFKWVIVFCVVALVSGIIRTETRQPAVASSNDASIPDPTGSAASVAARGSAAPVGSRLPPGSAISTLSVDELRIQADIAMKENRVYAPAGDNGLEYLILLRKKSPKDKLARSEIFEMEPYAVIAAEQAIVKEGLNYAVFG